MKKVAFFKGKESVHIFGDYEIHFFDDQSFIPQLSNFNKLITFIRRGLGQGINYPSFSLGFAEEIHRLYIRKEKWYMDFINYFIETFENFDIIVMSTYCPVHPEVISKLKKPIKILGFIDEPNSTYVRGVPFLWAFDGAIYISPSYNEEYLMNDMLLNWGCKNNFFLPLTSTHQHFKFSNDFFKRKNDICYVGNYYGSKVDRLVVLKKYFKNKLLIYGKDWPIKGYGGYLRFLFGKPLFPHKITSLTHTERKNLYLNTKIGFNMHLSEFKRETGNMRMYEVPAYGMMLISDKGGLDAHNMIFKDGIEAVYYETIDDAIQMIEYYLKMKIKELKLLRLVLSVGN